MGVDRGLILAGFVLLSFSILNSEDNCFRWNRIVKCIQNICIN